MHDYVSICLDMLKYAWICLNCLNGFCFMFSHSDPLSSWTCGSLFQRFQENWEFSWRDSLIFFSVVAGSIWFVFCFGMIPPSPDSSPFPEKKLHVSNIWDFNYRTRNECQKVDSFFWICCFSSKLSCRSYQQQVF